MSSQLLPFANAIIRTSTQGSVTMVNGRPVVAPGTIYVVKCFLHREQYTGVTSGSRKLPLESQLEGRMLPGVSGDQFYYRGYALQKLVLPNNVNWLGDLSSYTFTDITAQEAFLLPGKEVDVSLGYNPLIKGLIQRSDGRFGGKGIDGILYPELGVELQLTGSEVQN